MLDRIALDRVFGAANDRGITGCEVYAESRHQVTSHWREKLEDVAFLCTTGLSLVGSQKGILRTFRTSSLSTEALLRLIHGQPADAAASSWPAPHANAAESLSEALPFVATAARNLFADERARFPSLKYEGEIRSWQVAREGEPVREGSEELASLFAKWISVKNGESQLRQAERSQASIARITAMLKGNPFSIEMEESLDESPRWPAPYGAMPVLWSHRSVAKLFLAFVRAFEGDLVLANRSFLTRAELPLNLAFHVEDRPLSTHDHEGSATGPVLFLGEGKPRALALNHRLAAEFATSSTGHCRRQSLDHSATVALWNARLCPHQTVADLDRKMEWGLRVDDLQIASFNPATADATCRLSRVRLIHHGEAGETVEPFELSMSLLDILRALRWFSAEERTEGFRIHKHHQTLLTEVTIPCAVSQSLEIPGAVPPSHYW